MSYFPFVALIPLGAAACTAAGSPTATKQIAPGSPAAATAAPAAKAAVPATSTASPVAKAALASSSPVAAPARAASPAAGEQRTFQIQKDSSSARFVIDEVLRNSPFTVNGTTNQITGTITVDPVRPEGATIGTIQIDALSFKTDDPRRDSAIQRFILESAKYPEITFQPASIQGLPGSGVVGQSYNVEIPGDLTVRGMTRPETFEATLTVASPTRLEGLAQTGIRFADYGIQIPNVPFVQGVAEMVRLELDFVAISS